MALPSQINPILGTRLMDLLSRVATSNEIATFGFSNNNSGVKIRLYDNNNPSLGGIVGYTSSNYGFSFTRETGNVNVGINTSYTSSAFSVVGDCTLSGTLITSNLIVTGVSSVPITTGTGVTTNISIYNPTGTDSSGSNYKNITTNDTTSANRVLMNMSLNGGSYLFTTSLSYSNLNPSFAPTSNTVVLGLYRDNVSTFNINTSTPFQSMNVPLSNISQTFYNTMTSYLELSSPSNILVGISGVGQIVQFKGSANLINIGGIGANDSSTIDQTLQIAPIRQSFVVPSTTNIFSFTTSGVYQISTSSNVEVFQNTRKLYYYSPTSNDYVASYTNTTNSTTFTITTNKNIPANDILNITVWPTTLSSSFTNSYLYQVINDTSFNSLGLNINSTTGYVGMGTFNAPQRLSVVGKSIFSSNVGIGTSNPSALLTINDTWNDGTAPMVVQHSIIGQEFPPVGISNFAFTADYTDMISSIDIGREFSNLEYPPYAMTNFTTKFPNINGDYIAGSSTTYNNINVAWKAFDKTASTFWESSYGYDTINGNYIGNLYNTTDINNNNYPGEWIQISLPTPIKLSKYNLKSDSVTIVNNPSKWFILDSLDGINWSFLDYQNYFSWTVNTTTTFSINNPSRYSSYYRLVSSNIMSGNSTGTLKIYDWALFANLSVGQNNAYPKFKATIPYYTSTTPYGIGQYQVWANTIQDFSYSNQALPSGLFNKTIGSTSNTVWASYSNTYTSTTDATTNIPIIYAQFPDLLQLTSYSLTARGGNAQETPSKWTLYGSNTNQTMAWQSLNSQTGITTWTAFETKNYTVTTSSAYNFYKLELLRNSSSVATRMSLGELRFYGNKQTPEPRMVVSTNGFVGIGTTNPQTALDINGDLSVSGNLCTSLMRTGPNVNFDGSTTNRDTFLQWMQYVTSTEYRFALQTRNIASSTWWNTNNTISLYNDYIYNNDIITINNYSEGVLVPDGRIVCISFTSGYIGLFNPSTKYFTTVMGSAVSIAYRGGVLLPDGRVVFVPYNETTIGIFSPTTNTYTTVTTTLTANSQAYYGGVLLPDGRVLFVPYGVSTIGIFNPSTNLYSTYSTTLSSSSSAYQGGVLLPDGRVVFVPYYVSTIGIFNSFTNTYSVITTNLISSLVGSFKGGVLTPDGRVVFVPYNSTSIGIFNPTNNKYINISFSGANSTGAHSSGLLLPDGRVIFAPYNTSYFGIFNISNYSYSTIGFNGFTVFKYTDSILLPNGSIIFISDIQIANLITYTAARPPPLELCYHPCFNKF